MADYIQSNILFQSYVHIDADFDDLQQGSTADARDYLSAYIEERAKHFLDPSVNTTLEFKEGSIKAYATVRGTLAACLPPASDFVVAVNQLFWFAKRLSDAAVMELSFKTNSYLAAIERTGARPGIIGQTKRILDDLQGLNSTFNSKERGRLTRQLKSCFEKSIRLYEVLATEEDKELVCKEFLKLLRKVPKEFPGQQGQVGRLASEYEMYYEQFAKWLRNPTADSD